MQHFSVIFEIGRNANGLLASALFRGAIGLIALTFGALIAQRRYVGKAALRAYLGPLFLAIWGALWLAAHLPLLEMALIDLGRLASAHRAGLDEALVGRVHVLQRQPLHGRAGPEIVEIDGKRFEIDFFRATPGYRQTIAHGGVLKEGAFVRVRHYEGLLLEVEFSDGHPDSSAK